MKHIFSQVRVNLLVFLWLLIVIFAKRMALHVRVDDKGCQLVINLLLNFVSDDREEVESRQNRISQVNVVVKVALWPVNASNWIGCSDDRATSLQ